MAGPVLKRSDPGLEDDGGGYLSYEHVDQHSDDIAEQQVRRMLRGPLRQLRYVSTQEAAVRTARADRNSPRNNRPRQFGPVRRHESLEARSPLFEIVYGDGD
jgi:hypothetical protein